MADKWFISDTHFFHDNILQFTGEDNATRIRPMFDTVAQMNECMCERWNETVKPNDTVYHLGDVAFKTFERANELDILLRSLHVKKHLILGNHDDGARLHPYFKTVTLWKIFKDDGFFCSHVPLGRENFRGVNTQVHGHIHERVVGNPAYINVAVEQTGYRPVSMDEIKRRIEP